MPEQKATIHDDGNGAVVLAEIPAVLPREVLPLRTWETRERLAAHITRTFFDVSSRTLEAWPVRRILIGKRAALNTGEVLDHARKLMAEAEARAVMGGEAA